MASNITFGQAFERLNDGCMFNPDSMKEDTSPKNRFNVEASPKEYEEHTNSISTHESSHGGNSGKNRKKYSVIAQDAREKLLDLVLKKKLRIKEAAKLCNLKFSTSKAILATYRKEGRVGKKKTRARNTKVINTLIVAEVNPYDPTQTKIIPMVSVSETKLLSSQKATAMINGATKTMTNIESKPENKDGSAIKLKKIQTAPELSNVEISDSMSQMVDIASATARIKALGDVQAIVSKLMVGLNPTQVMPVMCLQNSIQQMQSQCKSSLEMLLAKRNGNNEASAAPSIPAHPQVPAPQMMPPTPATANQLPPSQMAPPSMERFQAMMKGQQQMRPPMGFPVFQGQQPRMMPPMQQPRGFIPQPSFPGFPQGLRLPTLNQ